MSLRLHHFFRSSTSFRVRAGLNLKGLAYERIPYALRDCEQRAPAHLALNPQGLVPTLETEEGPLTQSLAILEWLDETHPAPPLLPPDAWGRARVRSLAQALALDIHPLNNLRVLEYLKAPLGHDDAVVETWFRHWVAESFAALEIRLSREPQTGAFCHGDRPAMADICLAGQVLNNRRFAVDMAPFRRSAASTKRRWRCRPSPTPRPNANPMRPDAPIGTRMKRAPKGWNQIREDQDGQ